MKQSLSHNDENLIYFLISPDSSHCDAQGTVAIPSQSTISLASASSQRIGKDPANTQRSESENLQQEHPTNAVKEGKTTPPCKACVVSGSFGHTGSPIHTDWGAESMPQQKKFLRHFVSTRAMPPLSVIPQGKTANISFM